MTEYSTEDLDNLLDTAIRTGARLETFYNYLDTLLVNFSVMYGREARRIGAFTEERLRKNMINTREDVKNTWENLQETIEQYPNSNTVAEYLERINPLLMEFLEKTTDEETDRMYPSTV